MKGYQNYLKRWIDIFLSVSILIVCSPLLLILVFLVRVKIGSPVLFKQKRPGLNEKIFTMYKFRTMTDERNEKGVLLSDEKRLVPFGKKLRETSLDELPELFNIIKGDMSFVGPRPQLVRDMVFMSHAERKRHSVRPGLTGLAQISGRNNISWEDKLTYDLDYIKKIKFCKDMNILRKTILKVFNQRDITFDGMATAEDLGDYLLRTGKISKEAYDKGQKEAKKLY